MSLNEFQKTNEVYNMQVAGEEPSDKITDGLNILRINYKKRDNSGLFKGSRS